MNGETIAMIKALQVKSIENLKTSGGSADAGKVLTVGSDGKIAPIDLPVGEGQIALDGTLTIHGAAAGAKETGDAIRALNGSLDTVVARNLAKNTTWTIGKAIQAATGASYNSSGAAFTGFINISNCSRIMYMRRSFTQSYAPTSGMAFYDADKKYISGVPDGYKSGDTIPKVNTIAVPENAVYARFTYTSAEEILAEYPFFVYDADLYEAALETKVKQNTEDISAHYGSLKQIKADLDDNVNDLKSAIQPLGLAPYVCKYPSVASGYQNVPFTLPAGDYKVTVEESNVNIRFIDANNNNVIGPVPYTAVNYPITLTSTQASALAYLRMADSGVVYVYPAETILDDIDSIQSDIASVQAEVGNLATDLHELTGDKSWLVSSNFEPGTLYVDQSDNIKESSSDIKRVRQKISTAMHLTPSSAIYLSNYSHYRFLVFASTDNGITWTQGAWITSGNYVTAGSSTIYLILLEDTTADTADVDTLVNLIQYDEAGIFINEVDTKLKNISGNPYFTHLSFDDVQYCMIDLKNNADSYNSIFDNPFFAMLKNLHEVYGTVVSLYLFIANTEGGISAYPTKFANEFAANADWLKFGLHQGGTNYAETSAETALSDYNTFTSNIINIGGTVDIIDRCPRLGNFAGNLNSMLAMRDANGGIVGLLSAYDDRDSYYLSSADSAYLFNHGKFCDSEHHLTFFRTIKTFEVANPSTELPKLLTLAGMNGAPYGIIMMHEYGVYGSDFTLNNSMKSRLEYACAWMVNNGYAWDYPMNRIF